MPRKARVIVPGAFHHVMARGIDGRDLFKDDDGRRQFIKLLKEGLAHGRHRLYAWALLSNHYHLLIRVSDSPFSEMMRRLNSRYARFYSKKYRRRGCLFQDRYKSTVTQDLKYAEEILRYIHLNPIRSGLCKGLKELKSFPWSGHRAVMGSVAVEDKKAIKEILRRFGRNEQDARKAYVRFLEQGLSHKEDGGGIVDRLRKNNQGTESICSSGSRVIGDQEFVKKVLEQAKQRKLRLARYRAEHVTLDDVARKVGSALGVSIQQVRSRSRGGMASKARKVFSYVSRKAYEFPIKEIGRYLGICGPPVSMSVPQGEEIVKKDKGLKRLIYPSLVTSDFMRR
jgi:putative transposase